ncbi:MAG: hypoxanthine phosphoribosyltransferase [Pirellulales bacterium]
MELSDSAKAPARRGRPEIPCLISAPAIAERVGQLGRQISADYRGRRILVVGVLKGAWVFMADLVRQLRVPTQCDFVQLSSYGTDRVSSGRIELLHDITLVAEGEHVLLVEDLLDTGLSTKWLRDHLRAKKPASLCVCVLLDKPARRSVPVTADYVGFEIPDRFVVGYGIDYAQAYRELPYVGYIPEDDQTPER